MGNDTIIKELNYKNNISSLKSFSPLITHNRFCLFHSINDIYYLIYPTIDKSIILYDIIKKQLINEIKNPHKERIIIIQHCLDTFNNRDLILTLTEFSCEIKIWDIKNCECILNLVKVNKSSCLFSACFLNDFNQIYVITTNYGNKDNNNEPDKIRIFDLNGNIKKEINDSIYDKICFIDNYYDKKLSTIYIITGNIDYIKSYNYNSNNKLYRKYCYKKGIAHNYIIIYDKDKIIKLIDSGNENTVRIWNFHSGKLLYKIKVFQRELFSLCLYDDDNIIVGSEDGNIYMINIKYRKVIGKLSGDKNRILNVKKISSQKYGDFIISDGFELNIWQSSN